MSNMISTPNNPGSTGHGFAWQPVWVRSVDHDTRLAVCTDQFGKDLSVRCDIMRAKGNLPDPGEQWIIEKPYGQWIFGAIITGTTRGVEVSNVTDLPEALEDKQQQIDTNFVHRPTGDIEPTIRTIAKPDTLLLQGQQVSRSTYANLWAFAQEQSLITTGLFTNGNGSTTFGLPDFRGRAVFGAGSLGLDSYAVGALFGNSRITLSQDQLPSHNHTATTVSNHSHGGFTFAAGGHNHGGFTFSAGTHGPHPNFQIPVAAGTGANDVWAGARIDTGAHNHDILADNGHTHDILDDGQHSHTIGNTGGGQAVDARPPGIAVNWMVWV
jgi:microcystin-dependent protein